jgi:hypothetical protein
LSLMLGFCFSWYREKKMNALVRIASCAAGLAIAFYGLQWVSPDRVAAPLSSAAAPIRALAGSEEGTVHEEKSPLLQRVEKRRQVIVDLIGQRIMLREAVARFSELESSLPPSQQLRLRQAYPGRSNGEHYCWHILANAAAALEGHPEQAEKLMDYLRPQLREASSWSPNVSVPPVILQKPYALE